MVNWFLSDDDKIFRQVIKHLSLNKDLNVYEFSGWSRGHFQFRINSILYDFDYNGIEINNIIFKSKKYQNKLYNLLKDRYSKQEKIIHKRNLEEKQEEIKESFNILLKTHFEGNLLKLLIDSFSKAKQQKSIISKKQEYIRMEDNIFYIFPVESILYNSDKDLLTSIIIDFNKGLINITKSYRAYSNYMEYKTNFNLDNTEMLEFRLILLKHLAMENFNKKQEKKKLTNKILW